MKCLCCEVTWILNVLKGVTGGGGLCHRPGQQAVYFKLKQLASCTQKFKLLSKINGILLNNCNFVKFIISLRVGILFIGPGP